jgi:7,8-dihydropterin-6-yl-methyl-4-(beta-D-ribofuranosyl)aminobenzene 5'-phosphate synthase
MYLDTPLGLVVLTGCGHAGLVNTLEHVSRLTGGRRVHAVLGGFHLASASEDRMARTMLALHRFDVQRVGPAHCTGLTANARILAELPERYVRLATGVRITVP